MNINPHIKAITIGRVYNLGNYEHVRYEIQAICDEGDAQLTIIALERLIDGLRPAVGIKSKAELDRDATRIAEMRTMSAAAFERQYGNPVGGQDAYIARCVCDHAEECKKRDASIKRSKRIRQLFDDLGGAAVYKDAKLSWDDDENYRGDE